MPHFLKSFPKPLKNFIYITFVSLAIIGFFSFKILTVPAGLTVDEATFGLNGVLLSRTLHDSNGRFLPVFVLAPDHRDWKQPLTQYFIAGFFWLFGAEVFNLRLTSVLVVVASMWLGFFLAQKMLGNLYAWIVSTVFLTTPLVLIQSHLALDNIMVIPFTYAWLIGLFLYQQTHYKKFLILAGVSLGLGFYSYKAMRGFVGVWSMLTLVWLILSSTKTFPTKDYRDLLRKIGFFFVGLSPFLFIAPILEWQYPGSIFDRNNLTVDSVYSFLYPYFSSFDLSFLYIRGDDLDFHSTGKHGMMLLATAPLFFTGAFQAIRKKGWLQFLVIAFFLGPLLLGLVNSVHRASRLMALIPLYSLISGYGGLYLLRSSFKIDRVVFFTITLLSLLNFGDFVFYYWGDYANRSKSLFGNLSTYRSFQTFAKEANSRKLTPYISKDILREDDVSNRYFSQIYFKPPAAIWTTNNENPPAGSILLSPREHIPGMQKLDFQLPLYYLQVN